MVFEPPPLEVFFDAPAEEHAAVNAARAASAAVTRSGRDRWAKRIVQSSPAVGRDFLHYFAGDAKQGALSRSPTSLGELHNSRRLYDWLSGSVCGFPSKVEVGYGG